VTFRLLYVCVGNLCRSAFAERLTRHELSLQPASWARHFAVTSAGTRARSGRPMHPYTARLLPTLGADPVGFLTRRLTPALLADTDLILTATTRERDDVVGMLPVTLRRTFTINEFARLAGQVPHPAPDCAHDPTVPARRLVAGVLAQRGRTSADGAGPDGDVLPDDIVDPVGTPAAFAACGSGIGRTVREVVRALRGASDGYGVPVQKAEPERLTTTRAVRASRG
jgi:protein-tyrosine phosphatase